MHNDLKIIRLDPRQKKKASDVVAAAFYDYTMFISYFPDPVKRTRIMPWYLGNILNCALRYGEVYTTPDISGVIFILPPSHTKISQIEYALSGFLLAPVKLGLSYFFRMRECEKIVEKVREEIMARRLYYYIWGLAVDPRHYRRSVGTALLKPLIARADAEKMPIYLETHKETNIAYYKRMGFSLVRSVTISKYNLSFWCLVREPAGQ